MKKCAYHIISIITLIALAACQPGTATAPPSEAASSPDTSAPASVADPVAPAIADVESAAVSVEREYRIHITDMPTPSLGNDMPERQVFIMLPPDYYDTEKEYPVVYYLHGYGGTEREIQAYDKHLEAHFSANPDKAFILVGINGNSKSGASFYTNSPVLGNWEDCIVKDIVAYIDTNYRTIPSKEARGITGYSMGGYGAVSLALKYPDTFSAMFTIAPGLFVENGLQAAFATWSAGIKESYGAAFAPNTEKTGDPFDTPVFDGSEADNAIVEKWENGYGNLAGKIEAYKSLPLKLNAIHIEYGTSDRYTWIPEGCEYFSALLKANDIPHTITAFDGGHSFNREETIERFIAFFEGNLG